MRKERIKKVKRRPLYSESIDETKISKGINRNHESRKSISELARIILSEEK